MKQFIKKTVWEIDITALPRFKAYLLAFFRIILMAGFNFYERKTINYAASLTYYTLLNIVPIIAVLFGIAKGFGLEKLVEKQIIKIAENAKWQEEITQYIMSFSKNFLEHAKGGVIVGIGIVVLFWTVVAIIGKIETSFNSIWDIKKERTILRKFTDYMAIFIIAPILFTISNSITILISTKIGLIMAKIGMYGIIVHIVKVLLEVISYISLWMLLILLYLIIPNTRVPFKSAFIGGIVSGTLLHLLQWIYIKFQIGITKYGAIYGSFAALPLLFIWINFSWIIVLFGVEIAYASENKETYGWIPPFKNISLHTKEVLLVSVFTLICKQFYENKKPLNIKEISQIIKVPYSIVKEIVHNLNDARLISEVTEGNTSGLYQPARPLEGLTVEDILNRYKNLGLNFENYNSTYINQIKNLFQHLEISRKNLNENKEIKNLIL